MSIIAISLLGFSTTQIGVLDFLEAGAAIFLALPIGLLVDRYKPQTVLTLSLALKVLLGASLCLGLHFGLEKPAFFMAIVFFLGVSIIASENAQTSLVPFIARSDGRIENTVSRMAMADSIAGVVAPAAAGLALTFFGTTPTTGVAILFFALSLFFALRILQRLRQHQFSSNQNTTIDAVDESSKAAQPRKDNRPLSQKLTDGFRILGTNRFLLGAVCLISAGNVGLALSDSMVNVVILRVLDLGMPFFGILGTVSAAIGILAAAIAPPDYEYHPCANALHLEFHHASNRGVSADTGTPHPLVGARFLSHSISVLGFYPYHRQYRRVFIRSKSGG